MAQTFLKRRNRLETAPVEPRALSLPEFVQVTRQNIVHGEYLAALAELAKMTPCDGCELRDRCAAEQTACKAFVSFVHEKPDAWRGHSRRDPTHALYVASCVAESYEEALHIAALHALPEPAEQMKPVAYPPRGRCEEQRRQRARRMSKELAGRAVNGRTVVKVFLSPSEPRYRVVLRCSHCGRDAEYGVSTLQTGHVPKCDCQRSEQKKATNKKLLMDEFLGRTLANGWRCTGVEYSREKPDGTLGYPDWYLTLWSDALGMRIRRVASRVRKGIGLHPYSTRK